MIDEHDQNKINNLLEVLVCPVTKGRLILDLEAEEVVNVEAGLAYPIRNGIPVLLPDQARHLESSD